MTLVGGQNVCCSVSGGADSDILIDLCERAEPHFVSYVFFDTGIEYQATKEHLDWLEQKYGIEIYREKAKVPVPLGNKRYGVPFLSKNVSNMIWRLQSNGFQWEDDTFENLYAKYPKRRKIFIDDRGLETLDFDETLKEIRDILGVVITI